jgi:hypothetical protein
MNPSREELFEVKTRRLAVVATFVLTSSLVFACLFAGVGTTDAFGQAENALLFGFAHGTAALAGPTASEATDVPEILVFTSATGARVLALADRKGNYRVPLEPGKYCVSAYTSRGTTLKLSTEQEKCIEVAVQKDVRLDVTIARTLATTSAPAKTIELERELDAQVLSGRVLDAAQAPIPEVLVEQLSPDGKRVEAVLTDAKGKFAMKPRSPWVYLMKVSKPGFDSVLFKVRVSKNGNRELALTLTASP